LNTFSRYITAPISPIAGISITQNVPRGGYLVGFIFRMCVYVRARVCQERKNSNPLYIFQHINVLLKHF